MSSDPASTEGTRLERAGDVASQIGSLRPEDPFLRRALYLGIALVVALSVALAAWAALGELSDLHWRFRPFWLALGTLGFVVSLLFNAEVWRWLLAAMGPRLDPVRSAAIWYTSTLGRYVPTGIFVPMLRVAMAEREGVPKRVCLVSVVYEIATGVTAAIAVSAYFVIQLPELSGSPARFLVLLVPVLAVIAMQPKIFHPIADFALTRLGRQPLPLALGGWDVIRFVALYVVLWVISGLCVYALAQSVYPVDGGDLPTAIGAFAVGTTLSVFAFVLPGGLVAREAGLAVALAPAMPAAPAVAVAVLTRIVQLAMEVLLAVVTPVLARRREARQSAEAPQRS